MATDFLANYMADNFRLARSKVLTTPANDTYNVIRIPRFAFVDSVTLYISTALGVADAVTVGFSGNGEVANAAYFLDAAEADAGDAGYKQSVYPKYFSAAAGYLTITTVGADNGGVLQLLMKYTIIH